MSELNVQTFTNSRRNDNYHDVNKYIQDFLNNNPNIEVISMSRSSNRDRHGNNTEHFVTILYKNKLISL